MNKGQIVERIRKNLVRTDITPETVLTWINNRQTGICQIANFYFMETSWEAPTSADKRDYALPSGYKDELHIILISGTNRHPLTKWRDITPGKSMAQTKLTQRPTHYWIWAGGYWLEPIPNATYTLELKCFCYLAALVNDSDTNELTIRFSDLLIDGATADGFLSVGEKKLAATWELKYQGVPRSGTSPARGLCALMDYQYSRSLSNIQPRMQLRLK